ncbi:substrate-binding periplasmic protein [Aestuariispira insulae]|uniref:Polar amino acid transport system substrate-binding protein n=1 Tax=Aestuariispira insulae TaxID=1461337 RepID=A0A3D9HS48_9PROT|nr:transporter substrate-binding domain-containing protein [Aestuariispira insulae]RED52328.1 polar amino acid transport system substrate-binding protein [Aestuariispira insulae]
MNWLYLLTGLICLAPWSVRASDLPPILMNAGEAPPYTSEDLPGGGIGPALIREIFKRVGYDAEIRIRPWKRALQEGKTGSVDGVFFSIPGQGREKDFLFSDSVAEKSRYFYHLKSKPFNWSQLEDLRGKTIGIDATFIYPEEFLRLGEENHYYLASGRGLGVNVRLLLEGKIDLYPRIRGEVEYALKKRFSKQVRDLITYHPAPLEKQSFHVIFSRHAEKPEILLKAFNKGLAEVKADGTYQHMVEQAHQY